MRDITAALASRDCTVHACQKEADGPDGLCTEHRNDPRPGPAVEGVWCPTCNEHSLPIRGRCGWCDTLIAKDDDPITPPPPTTEEPEMAVCKIDGCPRASAGKGGPWAGMCQTHISEEIQRRQQKRRAKPNATAATKKKPSASAAPSNGEAPPRITDQARSARRQHPPRPRPCPRTTRGSRPGAPRSARPAGRLT